MHWRSIDLRGLVSRYLCDYVNGLFAYRANGLMSINVVMDFVHPECGSPRRLQQGFISGAAQLGPCVSEYAGAGLGTSRPVTHHIPLPTVGSQALIQLPFNTPPVKRHKSFSSAPIPSLALEVNT
jgi:hypothetical protein